MALLLGVTSPHRNSEFHAHAPRSLFPLFSQMISLMHPHFNIKDMSFVPVDVKAIPNVASSIIVISIIIFKLGRESDATHSILGHVIS